MTENYADHDELLALKARLGQDLNSGGRLPFLKPKEGENKVRVMPNGPGGQWYKEILSTWIKDETGTGRAITLELGTRSPAIEAKLQKMQADLEKAAAKAKPGDQAAAKRLKEMESDIRRTTPGPRYLVPVVARAEQNRGPQMWGLTKKQFFALVSVVSGDDWEGFNDPEKGVDITFTYKKNGIDNNGFATVTPIVPSRHSSPIGLDEEVWSADHFARVTPTDEEYIKAIIDGRRADFIEEQKAKRAQGQEQAEAEAPSDGSGTAGVSSADDAVKNAIAGL